jgi:hypothetical protein
MLTCRLIVTGDKALLFEPQSPEAKKFLEVMQQHMQARQQAGQQPSSYMASGGFQPGASHTEYMNRYEQV